MNGGLACEQIWEEIHAAAKAAVASIEGRQMSAEEARFYQEDWSAHHPVHCRS